MSIAIAHHRPVVLLPLKTIAFVDALSAIVSGAAAAVAPAIAAPSPQVLSRLDDLYAREGIRLMTVW